MPAGEYFDNAVDLLSSECEVLIANPKEVFHEYTY
jgi:hypothetical protein